MTDTNREFHNESPSTWIIRFPTRETKRLISLLHNNTTTYQPMQAVSFCTLQDKNGYSNWWTNCYIHSARMYTCYGVSATVLYTVVQNRWQLDAVAQNAVRVLHNYGDSEWLKVDQANVQFDPNTN